MLKIMEKREENESCKKVIIHMVKNRKEVKAVG